MIPRSTLLAALLGAWASPLEIPPALKAAGMKPPVLRRSRRFQPNGLRECARRVRQIAKGQLTESNGLARP